MILGDAELEAMNVDHEQEEELKKHEQARSTRFVTWFVFFMCSLVTLGSAIEASDRALDRKTASAQRWSVGCSALTFIVTSAVVVLHISSVYSMYIIGTKLEGSIIVVSAAFWASTVGVVCNSENGLAVNAMGTVTYGNLYYFSWAAFVCTVSLFMSYLRSVYHISVADEMKARGARISVWSGLLVFSVVMAGSSANVYDAMCYVQDGYEGEFVRPGAYCNRTVFAIVLGLLNACASLAVIGMKIGLTYSNHRAFLVEAGASAVLFLCMTFGVAFVTSEKGPGAPLGNLYYSSWGSFVCVFLIGVSCFDEYHATFLVNREMTSEFQRPMGMPTDDEDGTIEMSEQFLFSTEESMRGGLSSVAESSYVRPMSARELM